MNNQTQSKTVTSLPIPLPTVQYHGRGHHASTVTGPTSAVFNPRESVMVGYLCDRSGQRILAVEVMARSNQR